MKTENIDAEPLNGHADSCKVWTTTDKPCDCGAR